MRLPIYFFPVSQYLQIKIEYFSRKHNPVQLILLNLFSSHGIYKPLRFDSVQVLLTLCSEFKEGQVGLELSI